MIKFKYNGKIYSPVHPENKLKKLGITWDDVEIIKEEAKEEKREEYMNPTLHEFKNIKTGEVILSIYNNLNLDLENWKYIGLKQYE